MIVCLSMVVIPLTANAEIKYPPICSSELKQTRNGISLNFTACELTDSGEKFIMQFSCLFGMSIFTLQGGYEFKSSLDGLDFKEQANNNGSYYTKYRIGKQDYAEFLSFSSKKALGLYSDTDFTKLAKSMFYNEQVKFVVDTHDGTAKHTFNITGIEDLIEPVREACLW